MHSSAFLSGGESRNRWDPDSLILPSRRPYAPWMSTAAVEGKPHWTGHNRGRRCYLLHVLRCGCSVPVSWLEQRLQLSRMCEFQITLLSDACYLSVISNMHEHSYKLLAFSTSRGVPDLRGCVLVC